MDRAFERGNLVNDHSHADAIDPQIAALEVAERDRRAGIATTRDVDIRHLLEDENGIPEQLRTLAIGGM